MPCLLESVHDVSDNGGGHCRHQVDAVVNLWLSDTATVQLDDVTQRLTNFIRQLNNNHTAQHQTSASYDYYYTLQHYIRLTVFFPGQPG